MIKGLYPLYHCQKCGRFFKRIGDGFVEEGLSGQQSDVVPFICPECEEED